MSQTYVDIDQSTQTGTTVFGHLDDRTDSLLSTMSGTSLRGTPIVGEQNCHLDGSTSGYDVHKMYYDPEGTGDAWYEVGAFLHADLESIDGNHQLIGWRLENTGSDPTPAAGNVGRVILNTTGDRAKIVKDSSTLDTIFHGSAAEYIPIHVPVKACEFDATNPPTPTTIGTTPTVRGYLFDATNETISGNFPVPDGYSANADLRVEMAVILNAAETASDTIDATFDYVCTTPDNNETVTKTSTQATASQSIGANTAQYSTHILTFTIDYDDATNPVAAGDEIEWEFALSSVASVAAIVLRRITFHVPFGGTTLDT